MGLGGKRYRRAFVVGGRPSAESASVPSHQAKFAGFDFFDVELHGDEAIARMKKRKDLNKALGVKGAVGKPAGGAEVSFAAPCRQPPANLRLKGPVACSRLQHHP